MSHRLTHSRARSGRAAATAAALSLAMLATACGGSSDSEGAASDTTVTSETTASTVEETTTTVAPVATNPDAYCDFMGELDALDGFGDDITPAGVEAGLSPMFDALREVEGDIPAEIQADFNIAKGGMNALEKLLIAANWDVLAIADQLQPILEDPAIDEAFDNLDDYDEANCPERLALPDPDPSESTGGFAIDAETLEGMLSTETGRNAFVTSFATSLNITEEQAGCFIDETSTEQLAAFAAQDMDSVDLPGFLETLDTCGIPLEALS